MGTLLADPFVTLMPALLAGITNMIWVRLPVAKALLRPIDGGRIWRDGRALFGPNKTWKGLVGMVVLAAAFSLIWGWICAAHEPIGSHHRIYAAFGDSWSVSLIWGLAIGAVYAACELPNSFLKRRLDVTPGHTARRASTPTRLGLVILDQCDSVTGMVLLSWWPATLRPVEAGCWIALGGVTHLATNNLLYAVHLRRSPL
ncbi:MAG: CDP-archaeol synthase [Bifidobacteriaceae bacterium]|jgi:CDP-diglyceride synthetase|nr:CDP-archaeol synthase [Bifidobacteriaceae bacterium]